MIHKPQKLQIFTQYSQRVYDGYVNFSTKEGTLFIYELDPKGDPMVGTKLIAAFSPGCNWTIEVVSDGH